MRKDSFAIQSNSSYDFSNRPYISFIRVIEQFVQYLLLYQGKSGFVIKENLSSLVYLFHTFPCLHFKIFYCSAVWDYWWLSAWKRPMNCEIKIYLFSEVVWDKRRQNYEPSWKSRNDRLPVMSFIRIFKISLSVLSWRYCI